MRVDQAEDHLMQLMLGEQLMSVHDVMAGPLSCAKYSVGVCTDDSAEHQCVGQPVHVTNQGGSGAATAFQLHMCSCSCSGAWTAEARGVVHSEHYLGPHSGLINTKGVLSRSGRP